MARSDKKPGAITVSLVGTLQIFDGNGVDFTPRSKKARGIVALLMLSEDQRRSRSWLQDKLWSDRDPELGSASLRQALTHLRRALGPYRDCLVTRQGCVQLDPSRVRMSRQSASPKDDRDLCEDLDIQDPEFEDWLRDQRLAMPQSSPSDTASNVVRPVLVIGHQTINPAQAWILEALRGDIFRSLLEFGDVHIMDLQAEPSQLPRSTGPAVYLRISVLAKGDAVAVAARLQTLTDGLTVWQSPTEIVHSSQQDEAYWRLASLAQSCIARIQDELERQGAAQSSQGFALGLANHAIRTLYTFQRDDLIEADRLLKAAYELEPRGVYLSWRAFLRNTAIFEHLSDDFLEPCEGYELHANALSANPANSYSLVFAAQHSFVHDGDPAFGQSLCDRALEINPSNPMAWAFRSNMLIQQDQPDLAVQAADRGMLLARGLPHQATLALNTIMANIAAGNFEQAIQNGRYSELTQNKCQAIRRFLFVVFRALNMHNDADRQLSALRVREKSFQPEQLLQPNYPTWTLQKLPIAETLVAPNRLKNRR